MILRPIVEGEGKFFGVLGTNATLGGVRLFVDNAHAKLVNVMPFINDMLVIVQVAVGVATFVYIVLKICKVIKKKRDQD